MKTATIFNKMLLSAILLVSAFSINTNVNGQQWVVANKDNTHPENDKAYNAIPYVSSFTAIRSAGYNEINWTAVNEEDTRKFIVEYSTNGRDYQAAGELLIRTDNKSLYSFKHYTMDDHIMLYRIKSEQLNGRYVYSNDMLINGAAISPVTIYPTIITGNTINVNAAVAVERITISSIAGNQVYTKDVNGQSDYIPVVIPSLGKGMYWMTFYGRGWKTTTKFIVA